MLANSTGDAMVVEIDHHIHGMLQVRRSSANDSGWVDICKRAKGNGFEYYAKTRLDLNFGKQTKIPDTTFADPRMSAIELAAYLKKNPPVPKISKKVRAADAPLSSVCTSAPSRLLLVHRMCAEKRSRA